MTPEVERLDALASALQSRGLSAEPRYNEVPPLLRVRHPALPILGESISAVIGQAIGDRSPWWYRCSCRRLLAQCDDPEHAAMRIAEHLEPYVRQARGTATT